MSVAAEDKSYLDAIDERARDALRLSSENARDVAAPRRRLKRGWWKKRK